jgi:hypothetical protein
MDLDRVATPLGVLVIICLVAMGFLTGFQIWPGASGGNDVHVEAYPVGPEKPTPLNSSNVGDYAVSYEQRLFYNDLLASQQHSVDSDERVIADCATTSVSAVKTGEFRVQVACRGGVADSSQLSTSEGYSYSAVYQITETETQQIKVQNYPFATEREFNDERS